MFAVKSLFFLVHDAHTHLDCSLYFQVAGWLAY